MTTVVEQIKVEIDGETITVDHLSDGTFRKPAYLTKAEREKVRIPSDQIRNPKSINGGHGIDGGDRPYMQKAQELGYHERDSDVSVTVDAKRYDGFGTAMKPAWEPFLLGVKG